MKDILTEWRSFLSEKQKNTPNKNNKPKKNQPPPSNPQKNKQPAKSAIDPKVASKPSIPSKKENPNFNRRPEDFGPKEVIIKRMPKDFAQLVKEFEYEKSINKLSPISIVYYLSTKGFSGEILKEATHLILGESSGKINDINYNSDGTIDRGLWQINEKNILGSKAYENLKNKINANYNLEIKNLDNMELTDEQKRIRTENINKRREKELKTKMFSIYTVPFISINDALDLEKSTEYVLNRIRIMQNVLGESNKWEGWTSKKNNITLLSKYGQEKLNFAIEAIRQYNLLSSTNK